MQFSTVALALAAISSTVYAASSSAAQPTASVTPIDGGANPIIAPLGSEALKAGDSTTIKWTPTTGDTISLILREGKDQDNLGTVSTIATNIDNSGSFTWNIPSSLADAGDYSIQITSDRDTSNYSPMFSVDSNVKASSTSSSSSSTTSASTTTSSSSITTTTSSHNSTSTHTGSSTKTSSSATSTDSSSPSATKAATDLTGGASLQASSPLALVLCFIAGVLYFN
jgi:hypothetical protein